MVEIEGYKVVPLRLTPQQQNCHSIYMREHFIRLMDPNKPKGRTLLMLNIPPYITVDSLQKFFESIAGSDGIQSVSFAAKAGREETEKWIENDSQFANIRAPFSFKVAYIVFKLNSSVTKSLALKSIDLYRSGTGESLVETGMQLWHNEYKLSILDESLEQARIDAYLAEYDERDRAAQEAARNSEKDADGWITVGNQGRNAGFEQKETVVERLNAKDKTNKKGGKKELTNFYSFQIRESKMKNVIELRKKFEEDKRKIEMVKQTRRFRPF